MLKTTLGRFRVIAFLEGLSFVLLMFFAMPMKYMYGMPEYVRHIGMAHGILFIAYVYMLIPLKGTLNLSMKEVALLFLASILPFGTFIADYKMLRNREAI